MGSITSGWNVLTVGYCVSTISGIVDSCIFVVTGWGALLQNEMFWQWVIVWVQYLVLSIVVYLLLQDGEHYFKMKCFGSGLSCEYNVWYCRWLYICCYRMGSIISGWNVFTVGCHVSAMSRIVDNCIFVVTGWGALLQDEMFWQWVIMWVQCLVLSAIVYLLLQDGEHYFKMVCFSSGSSCDYHVWYCQ